MHGVANASHPAHSAAIRHFDRISVSPPQRCFADNVRPELFDREPFLFTHKLLGHPALSMDNLGRMIPALPERQVHYSSGRLQTSDNFERAHTDHANGMCIEETIATLRTSNSYIMIREPQEDESFHPLFRELVDDVNGVLGRRDGGRAHDAKMYLFLSSPNSVTPFHIDRATNFLMQFQGSKEISVFPQWDPRVMTAAERESHVSRGRHRPLWRPETQSLATTFQFKPGDALHIPFVAGHHVRNGPEDVSISLSIFFQTDETRLLTDAMVLNHHLRERLKWRPAGVGTARWRDGLKAGAWRTGRGVAQALRRTD
jgi:hypothetical protein